MKARRNRCARWAAALLAAAFMVSAPFVPASLAAPSAPVAVSFPGGPCTFKAELAVTPEEHTLGLMFRRRLDADAGMLFRFQRDEVRSFWMQNTFIPLDMIFITSGLKVAHVHQSAKPEDETAISSRLPVQYVLEVNAGKAASCRIKAGAKVRFTAPSR